MHSYTKKLISVTVSVILLILIAFFGYIVFENVTKAVDDVVSIEPPVSTSQALMTEQESSKPPLLPQCAPEVARFDAAVKQNTGKVCYLTIDDGSSENTPRILQVLSEFNINATFFVTGNGNPDYFKQIVDEKNAIAIHTYSHKYSDIYASDEAFFEDFGKIDDLIFEKTGVRTKLTRFPGGTSNTVSRSYSTGIMTRLTKALTDKGYIYHDWNASTGDAAPDAPVPVERIIKNIENNGVYYDKLVVLMHDSEKQTTTPDALPHIIKYYYDNGYDFEIIDETVEPIHLKLAN